MGMLGWSFAARTADEVGRLVRALGKHRYVREADLRLHWTVDRALEALPRFAEPARAFRALCAADAQLDLRSRDPRLWRSATADDVAGVLDVFWTPGAEAAACSARLVELVESLDLPPPAHDPFESSEADPPHPELLLLDWVLLPVDELDSDRHAGALAALEDSGEEVDASAPVYQEGPTIALPELVLGATSGVLAEDFLIWADGPYAYVDYVLRGAAKAAKLVDPPVGFRDL
jgi:hypothetical protein